MIKIAIAGAGGRMGKAILSYVIENDLHTKFQIVAALVKPDDVLVGEKALSLCDLVYTSDKDYEIAKCDVLIDFTEQNSTVELAFLCSKHGKAMVSGVTGLSDQDLNKLAEYSKITKIFRAPNMSIGIAMMAKALTHLAGNLPESFDIEILEKHHRNKIDAPSGTAIYLAEQIAAISPKHQINYNTDRNGVRQKDNICFSVSRGGTIIGEHTVTFAGDNESISIQHTAQSRDIFVKGALAAVEFISKQRPGKLYSMADMLGC